MSKKNLLKEKIFKNQLIIEKLTKLSNEERHELIEGLLKTRSQQQLSDEIDVPKSTIQDWHSQRQCCVRKLIHVSLASIIRKLSDFKVSTSDDTIKLIQIKKIIERILEVGKK